MTSPPADVSAAVDRILEGLDGEADADAPVAASASHLRSAVLEVAAHLERPGEAPTLEGRTAAEKAVVRTAVDRVRGALLDRADSGDAEDVLEVLKRLESIRRAAASDRTGDVAAQLSGSEGLNLVIEVAHDLRSPLNSIMFLSEALRSGQSGPTTDLQRQQLRIIYGAALGLLSVANDLMDMAREGDPSEISDFAAEPFSLAALLESVHTLVRPMLEEKGLRLDVRLPQGDLRVGRKLPLSRALLNLVTNAIRFTDQGRIDVVVRETGESRLEFSVRDRGRGMEPAAIESVYDTFRRGKTETGYRFSEAGLGLSLCRRMVGIMGGTLLVESERGRGTRFWFEVDMPEAELAGSAAGGSEEERAGQGRAGFEGE